jgi:trans-aconitate methyltransferase
VDKPFSQSCENNRAPILAVLESVFVHCRRVLEIGSGTGQHAVYFAPRLPQLQWQPSDVRENLPGIEAWRAAKPAGNLLPPVALDVRVQPWAVAPVDGLFTANTLHIMAWEVVRAFFAGLRGVLVPGGVLAVYGPFNYGGEYTSESNARFDEWLKSRDPRQGIRDVERVAELAAAAGLVLEEDNAMPANNRLLVWRASA